MIVINLKGTVLLCKGCICTESELILGAEIIVSLFLRGIGVNSAFPGMQQQKPGTHRIWASVHLS